VRVNEAPKDLSAAERSRWLAELSAALEEADQLAARLGLARMHSREAMELLMRLAAARAQAQALRLGRPDDRSGDTGPKWSNPPLWPDESPEKR
jgi:hypothetical protein